MKLVSGILLAVLIMATPAAAATTWPNTPMPAGGSWGGQDVAVFSAKNTIDSATGAVFTVGNTTEVLHPNAVAMKLVG
jgi:hypothetical protein